MASAFTSWGERNVTPDIRGQRLNLHTPFTLLAITLSPRIVIVVDISILFISPPVGRGGSRGLGNDTQHQKLNEVYDLEARRNR